MREVAIIGIGQTKIDEHWGRSIRDLAGEAIVATLQDANRNQFDALFSGNMLSGLIDQQNNLGAVIADWMGFKGESVKIESACSSGASAFRAGIMAVASGEIDSAMIVGDTGKVVPPENSVKLAEAINTFLELPCEKRRILGMQARRRIKNFYSIENITKRYQSLYQSLI